MSFSTQAPRLLQSLPGGLINGGINGAISWSAFKSLPQVPLSMDSISSPGVTALGNAATAVLALTFIITSITFFVFRRGARKSGSAPDALTQMPYWTQGLGIAVRNTLLSFGAFVAAAVLWQRFVGTVMVSPVAAALVVAVMALAATVWSEMRTKREMLGLPG